MPSIIVLEGKNRGQRFAFDDRAIIGRGKVEIRLSDTAASRQHARVYRNGDRFFVVDLQSSNGTKVNDAAIANQEIRTGDTIRIGSTLLRFEGEAAPPPRPTPTAPPPAARPRAPEPEPPAPDVAPTVSGVAPTVSGPATIESREEMLQYSEYAGGGSSFLSQDLGQRGLAFRALLVLVLVALGAGLLYAAYWLTTSAV